MGKLAFEDLTTCEQRRLRWGLRSSVTGQFLVFVGLVAGAALLFSFNQYPMSWPYCRLAFWALADAGAALGIIGAMFSLWASRCPLKSGLRTLVLGLAGTVVFNLVSLSCRTDDLLDILSVECVSLSCLLNSCFALAVLALLGDASGWRVVVELWRSIRSLVSSAPQALRSPEFRRILRIYSATVLTALPITMIWFRWLVPDWLDQPADVLIYAIIVVAGFPLSLLLSLVLLSVFALWGLLALSASIHYRSLTRARGWLRDLAWSGRSRHTSWTDPL